MFFPKELLALAEDVRFETQVISSFSSSVVFYVVR